MVSESPKWQNIDADDLPADVKKSFDAMVEAEATFKADLEKLLKSEGHMPEDKFLVMRWSRENVRGVGTSCNTEEHGHLVKARPLRHDHVAAVRGVVHGAMALYLARYLNVPPARIPGEGGEQLDELPANAEMIRAALLDAFDRQRQVDLAARLVARHLTLGHSTQALITTLARA
jgi:hypothetical protein